MKPDQEPLDFENSLKQALADEATRAVSDKHDVMPAIRARMRRAPVAPAGWSLGGVLRGAGLGLAALAGAAAIGWQAAQPSPTNTATPAPTVAPTASPAPTIPASTSVPTPQPIPTTITPPTVAPQPTRASSFGRGQVLGLSWPISDTLVLHTPNGLQGYSPDTLALVGEDFLADLIAVPQFQRDGKGMLLTQRGKLVLMRAEQRLPVSSVPLTNLLNAFSIATQPDSPVFVTMPRVGAFEVRDVGTGALRRTLQMSQTLFANMALAADGSRLTVLTSEQEPGTGRVIVFDTTSGNQLRAITSKRYNPISSVRMGRLQLSDDGKTVAVITATHVEIFDLDTGTLRAEIPIPGAAANFALSRDGARYAMMFVAEKQGKSTGTALHVFNAKTGALQYQRDWPLTSNIAFLEFNPTGDKVAALIDGAPRVFDLAINREIVSEPVLPGALAEAVRFLPNGRQFIAGYAFGGLRVVDAERGELNRTLAATRNYNGYAFSANGARMAALRIENIFGDVDVYDLASGNIITTVGTYTETNGEANGPIGHLALSPDGGSLIYVDGRSRLIKQDLRTAQRSVLLTDTNASGPISMADDGASLAFVGPNGSVVLARNGKVTAVITDTAQPEFAPVASPVQPPVAPIPIDAPSAVAPPMVLHVPGSSNVIVANPRGEVTLREGTTGAVLRRYASNSRHVGEVTIAVGPGNTPQRDALLAVARAPGRVDMVPAQGWVTIDVYDIATGALKYQLDGHRYAVTSIGFSQDGSQLVSAGWDGVIRTWELVANPAADLPPSANTGTVADWLNQAGIDVQTFQRQRREDGGAYIEVGTSAGRIWIQVFATEANAQAYAALPAGERGTHLRRGTVVVTAGAALQQRLADALP